MNLKHCKILGQTYHSPQWCSLIWICEYLGNITPQSEMLLLNMSYGKELSNCMTMIYMNRD